MLSFCNQYIGVNETYGGRGVDGGGRVYEDVAHYLRPRRCVRRQQFRICFAVEFQVVSVGIYGRTGGFQLTPPLLTRLEYEDILRLRERHQNVFLETNALMSVVSVRDAIHSVMNREVLRAAARVGHHLVVSSPEDLSDIDEEIRFKEINTTIDGRTDECLRLFHVMQHFVSVFVLNDTAFESVGDECH